MRSIDGVAEITSAKWNPGEGSWLDMYVHDEQDRSIHVWMALRPLYCDRGHIQVNVEGIMDLDAADSFPRYFFNFEEADKHVRAFLKWRLWKYRTNPHTLVPTT